MSNCQITYFKKYASLFSPILRILLKVQALETRPNFYEKQVLVKKSCEGARNVIPALFFRAYTSGTVASGQR